MKKYRVYATNRSFGFVFDTNKLKTAKFITKLKIWRYAKIMDNSSLLTIYIKD